MLAHGRRRVLETRYWRSPESTSGGSGPGLYGGDGSTCGWHSGCTGPDHAAGSGLSPGDCGSAGGLRTSNAAGMISSHERAPRVNIAVRQPYSSISHRPNGEIIIEPTAKPAEMSATARLRCRVNQCVAVAVSGA